MDVLQPVLIYDKKLKKKMAVVVGAIKYFFERSPILK